tara:strand:+ start:354 stop:1184 length:831 start_codon:yes stop_codon:yes gene_type:complete
MTTKEYYDKHVKSEDEGVCYCGEITTYHGWAYKKYCSAKCAKSSDEHREAVSKRFINNPDALVSYRNSRKGVDNNIQKRRETIQQKADGLGMTLDEYYSDHSKRGSRSISPKQRARMTEKRMDTIEKSGKVCGRSGYKSYEFFGEQVSLQGYEPQVLECLTNDFGLTKEQIMVGKSNIPVIRYGKNRRYFPDFFLPESNLVIEVKSPYTLRQHYDNVMAKCEATVESGYSIVLVVVTQEEARKRKLDGSKKLLDWAISSQAPNPTWYGEGSTTNPW